MRSLSRITRVSLCGVAAAVTALGLASAPTQAHDPETDTVEAGRAIAARVPAAPAERLAEQRVADGFEVVGHHGLFKRGMNAAPAVYRHYVYVGNRTDGSEGHRRPGVQVVDVADPSEPRVVGAIGAPHEANRGESSRELRVWPRQKLLIVMNFQCSSFIHDCADDVEVRSTITFYDISGRNAADPQHVATYLPREKPHEMFLWIDPEDRDRALLYYSTPNIDTTGTNMVVADISDARDGVVREVATFNPNRRYPARTRQLRDVALHSMALNQRGTRLYLAYLGGGFLVADTSELARDEADARVRLITPVKNRVRYSNPGAHSAVKVPGERLVVLTEEVYGDLLDYSDPTSGFIDDEGCPWGWVRIADISDPRHPQVVGEYRTRQNYRSYCDTEAGQDEQNTTYTSYAAHNPTVLEDLALVTWHSSGLQAFSLSDPTDPDRTGKFSPRPLRSVATEDPALSAGRNKVVMWSYPIIKDGLIYVVDVRNGLYVLRYTGPGREAVDQVRFYEGNSNRGAAVPRSSR